jgi:hypothetical protein
MRRLRLPRLVLMLVMLAIPLALAGPASAQPAPEGQFCVWQHSSFGGESECFPPGNHNLSSLDNRVSSLQNNTGTTLCAFQLPGQGGFQLPVGGNNYFRNLALDTAPDGGSWNDRISSIGYCR